MATANSSARRKEEMNKGMRMGIQRLGLLHQAAGVKVSAPGLLGGDNLIRLLDQGGDKPQRDAHNHGQFVDGEPTFFRGRSKPLQPSVRVMGEVV